MITWNESGKKLRCFQERISKELSTTQSHFDEQKRANLDLLEAKMKDFAAHTRCVLNETLIDLSDNEVILSKLTSINTEPLNDRIRGLQEQAALVASLLEQSYINKDLLTGVKSKQTTPCSRK